MGKQGRKPAFFSFRTCIVFVVVVVVVVVMDGLDKETSPRMVEMQGDEGPQP